MAVDQTPDRLVWERPQAASVRRCLEVVPGGHFWFRLVPLGTRSESYVL